MANHVPQALEDAAAGVSVDLARTREVHFLHQQTHGRAIRDARITQAMIDWATAYGDKDESCPICFEKFLATETDKEHGAQPDPSGINNGCSEFPILTPCMHKFGNLCLERWLFTSSSCPLCRAELLSPGLERNEDAQTHQRRHTIVPYSTYTYLLNPLRTPLATNPTERALARSLSTGSNRYLTTATFQQQIWDARMGRLGFTNPHFDNPRNAPEALNYDGTIRVSLPPATTPHAHPAPRVTTTFTAEYTRRHYPNSNLTSYTLRNQTDNTSTQRSPLVREQANSRWRGWDYLLGAHHRAIPTRREARNTHSVASALGLAMGAGMVVGMPRGEMIVPVGGDGTRSVSADSRNQHLVAREMGQDLGVGTVVGMSRAELMTSSNWRRAPESNSVGDTGVETRVDEDSSTSSTGEASRGRETFSMEEALSEFPGLGSSMWAHPSP